MFKSIRKNLNEICHRNCVIMKSEKIRVSSSRSQEVTCPLAKLRSFTSTPTSCIFNVNSTTKHQKLSTENLDLKSRKRPRDSASKLTSSKCWKIPKQSLAIRDNSDCSIDKSSNVSRRILTRKIRRVSGAEDANVAAVAISMSEGRRDPFYLDVAGNIKRRKKPILKISQTKYKTRSSFKNSEEAGSDTKEVGEGVLSSSLDACSPNNVSVVSTKATGHEHPDGEIDLSNSGNTKDQFCVRRNPLVIRRRFRTSLGRKLRCRNTNRDRTIGKSYDSIVAESISNASSFRMDEMANSKTPSSTPRRRTLKLKKLLQQLVSENTDDLFTQNAVTQKLRRKASSALKGYAHDKNPGENRSPKGSKLKTCECKDVAGERLGHCCEQDDKRNSHIRLRVRKSKEDSRKFVENAVGGLEKLTIDNKVKKLYLALPSDSLKKMSVEIIKGEKRHRLRHRESKVIPDPNVELNVPGVSIIDPNTYSSCSSEDEYEGMAAGSGYGSNVRTFCKDTTYLKKLFPGVLTEIIENALIDAVPKDEHVVSEFADMEKAIYLIKTYQKEQFEARKSSLRNSSRTK